MIVKKELSLAMDGTVILFIVLSYQHVYAYVELQSPTKVIKISFVLSSS